MRKLCASKKGYVGIECPVCETVISGKLTLIYVMGNRFERFPDRVIALTVDPNGITHEIFRMNGEKFWNRVDN